MLFRDWALKLYFVDFLFIFWKNSARNPFRWAYSAWKMHFLNNFISYNEKRVSLNEKNISLIYGQRKNFYKLKNVFLIRTNFLWSIEIDLFKLKEICLNQQNFLQFKEILSLTVYQRNVSLIQRNSFLSVIVNVLVFTSRLKTVAK